MIADYDIICLTETWLLPGIFDSELFDSRYVIYRMDRDYDRHGTTRGGGTLIAVRRGLRADLRTVRPLPSLADTEITSINISLAKTGNTKIIKIFCCYFLQSANQELSEQTFFDYVSDLSIDEPENEYIIVGDFNIRDASWSLNQESEMTLCNPYTNKLVTQLHNFLSFTGWAQYNNVSNLNNRYLDLVISGTRCTVSRTEPLSLPEDAHHPSLSIECAIDGATGLLSARRTVRRFYAADYGVIRQAIMNVDWEEHLSLCDVNSAVDNFYKVLNTIIECHVPQRTLNNGSSFPIWYSRCLINLIKKKQKIHKKWKTYNRLSDYMEFSYLRKEIKLLQTSCYKSYIDKTETNIKNNIKNFWSYIKSKKGTNFIPDTLYYDNVTENDGLSIANMFNSFFQSVFENESANFSSDQPSSEPNSCIISKVEVNTEIVKKYLSALDASKGSGPDGVHPYFLKMCSNELANPLAFLFRLSLSRGVMPNIWKQSLVVPIYKNGDKHDITNYRGISKLSVIPKLFEKIIYDSLFPAIRPFLITQQHGFINKRSTETNLCEFLDQVVHGMDSGFQVDAVYTDYSKCFDKISHKILIKKLEYVGIHGDLLRWLESYLHNRTQAVTLKGYISSFIPVPSGVPQGSHLGPLLFNIFINDVVNCLQNSQCLLFADDTKIFKVIKSPEDCIQLQDDLDRLCQYCDKNYLRLNINKCCVISYSRKKQPLTFNYQLFNRNLNRTSEVRDLGITLDSELLLSQHVNKIAAKAYQMLGFIFRQGVDFKDPKTLILLYNSLVRSQLEYASTVWNPQYSIYISTIERIQTKFIKRMNYKFDNFSPISIPSLEARREHCDQLLLYKIINGYVDSPYLLDKVSLKCPRPNLRARDTFAVPACRTNYACNRFIPRALKSYNSKYCHIDVFGLKPAKFKHLLKDCT